MVYPFKIVLEWLARSRKKTGAPIRLSAFHRALSTQENRELNAPAPISRVLVLFRHAGLDPASSLCISGFRLAPE
jgi:hypothetical protein